jgi:hypothetical protein
MQLIMKKSRNLRLVKMESGNGKENEKSRYINGEK